MHKRKTSLSSAHRRLGRAAAAALAVGGVALAASAVGDAHQLKAGAAASKLKVAFLYENSITDLGWDTAMYQGQVGVEKEYGSRISVTDKVVTDGPDDATEIDSLIKQGYKLIFTTAFAQQTYSLPIAKKNPSVYFVQAESTTLPNVSSYFTEDEDGFYLAGMAAASVAKGDTFGMIGGFPISDNLAEANGFALGADAINPKITTDVTWTDNWDSVSIAQNAATALINEGASALAFLTTGAAPGETASQKGIPWIGYQAEQKSAGPSEYLTGVLWNLKPLFLSSVAEVLDGKWKATTSYVNMQQGTVSLDETGKLWAKVPASVKAKIAVKMKAFQSGKASPFEGPLYTQAGKLIVPAGKALTDAQVADMNYLVKGTSGKVPAS
jgi:basic membrane lipoprotein Med (substrate-binding protein (PBP1-ABC) superfamily)